jgi:hypothetical protein
MIYKIAALIIALSVAFLAITKVVGHHKICHGGAGYRSCTTHPGLW